MKNEIQAAMSALIKYAEWQINEGENYHPTLPSAIEHAKSVLNQDAGDLDIDQLEKSCIDHIKNICENFKSIFPDRLSIRLSLEHLATKGYLNTPKIPDGWKLVPIEPTDVMVNAPNTIIQSYGAKLIWQRMLSAAPEHSKGE